MDMSKALMGWGLRTGDLTPRAVQRSKPKRHGKYNGLRELARQKKFPYARLQSRVRHGYTIEQALSMPVHARRKKVQP